MLIQIILLKRLLKSILTQKWGFHGLGPFGFEVITNLNLILQRSYLEHYKTTIISISYHEIIFSDSHNLPFSTVHF